MDLPVRILAAPPAEPVLLVDGVFDAPGLNLSHWPGHRTPPDLRHDLSTGSVLAFDRLPEDRRRELALGCTAIANNHYDTDGTCALWAARFPEAALERAEALLAAARAGDFFQLPTRDAWRVDRVVGALTEPGSPLHGELAPLSDAERWQRQTDHWMEHFGALIDGGFAPYRGLYETAEARLDADLAEVVRAERHEDPTRDLVRWNGGPDFAPGRHALHGSTERDRVLVLGEGPGGCTVRLLLSTLSWFDLVDAQRLPRPDLEALVDELNALEGTDPSGGAEAWRSHPASGAAPELWFGTPGVPKYAEHNAHLAPSALEPRVLVEAFDRALA